MNGFDSYESHSTGHVVPEAQPADLTRADLERYVARAQQLRAEYIGARLRNGARSLLSVFRRPGRLLPAQFVARKRLTHSA